MFELKDIIYICINVISVTVLFVAFKFQIKEISNDIKSLKVDFKDYKIAIDKESLDQKKSVNKVLFADGGGLNFVRHDECQRKHERVDLNISNINKYLHRVDRNILIIMERLKIKPDLKYRDMNEGELEDIIA